MKEGGGGGAILSTERKYVIILSTVWGRSSVGRTPALHAGGRGFESPRLHSEAKSSRGTKNEWF
jgi:hypothetical protein